PPPPPGLNYIAAIQPSFNMLMIGTSFSAALIPLLIVLFFFSTKALRRMPIFILNVISILLGISMGILNVYRTLVSPSKLHPSGDITMGCLIFIIPFFVESILVFRIFAVYPPRTTPTKVIVAISIPLLLLKTGRIANATQFLVRYAKIAREIPNPMIAGQISWTANPGQRIEWGLQMADNSLASFLFLRRLNTGMLVAKDSSVQVVGGLFWIAVSNFVFPVLLSLAQLIFSFKDPSFLDGNYVFMCNDYVAIIGVLLATVWTAGNQWSNE
ncbi:hypothetical protein BDQ12DRAFT_569585, partial [Crucibulum laeve]